MPKIPRITQPTVEQRIVTQPHAQNVDVSSGMQKLATSIQNIGQMSLEIKGRNDKAEAESALLAFDDAKNEVLFNPTDGYYNTKSRAAVDAVDGTNQRLDSLLKEYTTGIKSEEARSLFQKAVNTRVIRDKEGIMRHSSKEMQVWEIGNSKAEEDNAVKNATIFSNDDNELNTYMTKGELAILDRKKYVGDEQTTAALATFRSSFAKNAIDGALSRDDVDRAKVLRDKYDNVLMGSNRSTSDTAIQKKVDKVYINQKFAEIYQPGKNLKDMLSEVDSEPDVEKQKEIRNLVTKAYTGDKAATEEYLSDKYNDFAYSIEQGQAGYLDIESDNPEVFQQMTPKQRENLRAIEKKVMERSKIVTDETVKNMLDMMTTNQLIQINPADHRLNLADADYDKLVARWRKAKEGTEDDESKFGRTKATALNKTLEQLYGKPAKADIEDVNSFARMVGDQAAAEGIKTLSEYEEMLARMTAKFVIEDGGFAWFDKNDATIQLIPAEYLSDIAAELRRSKRKVTPKNMHKLYTDAVAQGVIKK